MKVISDFPYSKSDRDNRETPSIARRSLQTGTLINSRGTHDTFSPNSVATNWFRDSHAERYGMEDDRVSGHYAEAYGSSFGRFVGWWRR